MTGARRAVVVGSANMDLVYRVGVLPAPGETVLATGPVRHPGGKGNNQVIAIARAGASASFVASIGADADGDELVRVLADAAVATFLRRPAAPTGTALITVDDAGENTIVVSSGANGELVDLGDHELGLVAESDVLLLQLEIPLATVRQAAAAARAAGTLVVLNAAPFQPLPDDLLEAVDVLVLNEVEAAALGDAPRQRVRSWVVTRGSRGALVHDAGVDVEVPALRVPAVDTTGAGDTFCGALVAALCEGRSLADAARFAVVAAALSVQRPGAVSSIPTRAQIDAAAGGDRDPLVPRPIDLPTMLPADRAALDAAKIFGAPDDPSAWPAWRDALATWRDDARSRLDPDDAAYREPSTQWASRCYSVALTWLWDERLFDHADQRFTPERFVTETAAFGGFDAIVLWHAYPVVGIDERDQFDFYRNVPNLTELVTWFRAHEIRVFVDYNPWDTQRHGDHPSAIAAVVTDLSADGVFLDTMTRGGGPLVEALRSLDPPAVLEGESRVPLPAIADHQISWAQWFADTPAPGVLRAHWFERRHMQHHTRRWNRHHGDELQSSWMNGTGIVVWDAVFGSWVGWNERDQTTLRAMVRVQRALSDVFLAGEWTPLTDAAPEALAASVFVSRWRLGDVTVWTAVNRSEDDYCGPLLDPSVAGAGCWFEVTRGRELATGDAEVTVPGRGVAGIVRAAAEMPALEELAAAATLDAGGADTTFPDRRAVRVAPPRSTVAVAPAEAVVLAPGVRRLTITYRLRETGLYGGAPFVEEWKPLPPRLHAERSETVEVSIGSVAVAPEEVTGAEFERFVEESGYRPAVPNRFAPGGGAGAAATHVGLTDARACAAWFGARLPTEHEWQVAAGDERFRRAVPEVWNWTESEHSDGVTRFVMLKGGAAHRAAASEWYFDGGVRPPEFTAKLLLPGLGLERSSWIGFRLAWDLA